LGKDLGMPTCLSALAITAIVCIKERSNPLVLARKISWETLLLVAGLFVMVDAIESIGAMRYTKEWLNWVQHLSLVSGSLIAGFAVGVANNLVNNLPLGLIVGSTLHAAHAKWPIASGSHRGRSWTESFDHWVAGNHSLVDCFAQRESRCKFLGFPEGGCDCHATRPARGARRCNFNAVVFCNFVSCVLYSPPSRPMNYFMPRDHGSDNFITFARRI